MLPLYDVALDGAKRRIMRKLSSDCAESDSNVIKYIFKGYKLSEITQNIYS